MTEGQGTRTRARERVYACVRIHIIYIVKVVKEKPSAQMQAADLIFDGLFVDGGLRLFLCFVGSFVQSRVGASLLLHVLFAEKEHQREKQACPKQRNDNIVKSCKNPHEGKGGNTQRAKNGGYNTASLHKNPFSKQLFS